MTKKVISDGSYFASGYFVCQRALVVSESGVETEVSTSRTICLAAEGAPDRPAIARTIAAAMNAQRDEAAGKTHTPIPLDQILT